MPDLFDAREGEPSELTAGDLWTWRKDDLASAYPPATHVVSYTLTPQAGGTATPVTASEDATGYLVSFTPTVTAAIAAGVYVLTGTVTRTTDGARATFGSWKVTVNANPVTSTADSRSQNKIILDAIEAKIAGRVTKDAESYAIEGRSISRIPIMELRKLAGTYRALVRRENGGRGYGVRLTSFRT